MIDFKELIDAGLHYGHITSRWCPKMAPYIWGSKNNIHLIDVSKTARQLEKAAQFLEGVASEGKTILWVGTKKPAQGAIAAIAKRLSMPHVKHRWIGGLLSNYPQVKKSVTKLLHYEDIVERSDKFPHYTKKEINTFQKIVDRLEKNIGGIRNLAWPVGAVVIVDVRKERSALKEAAVMGVPVVALVDTNSDPTLVDYVIPGNDDISRAIEFVLNYLGDSVEAGQKAAVAEKQVEKKTPAKKAKVAVEQVAASEEKVEKKVEAVAKKESPAKKEKKEVKAEPVKPKSVAKKPVEKKKSDAESAKDVSKQVEK